MKKFRNVEGKMENPGEILYHILDRCVDEYVSLINNIEDKVDEWELAIHQDPYAKVALDIFRMKRMTHDLRRIFVEERTMLSTISHQSFPSTVVLLRWFIWNESKKYP